MISMKNNLAIAGFVAIAALLSGCQQTSDVAHATTDALKDPINSMRGMKAERDERLSNAAADAIASGKIDEALRYYAGLHKQHRHDRNIALVYAQLLRRTGSPQEAVHVLEPFASYTARSNDQNTVVIYHSDAVVLNELAAAHIATGNFDAAQKLLQHVIDDKDSGPMHADAYSLMGIVLDAKGQHRDAEKMFNNALAGWKGDPTPVMNNLALCLAAQGQFDAALDTLRRALVISPNDKQEIARNIALISELRGNIIAKPVVVKEVKHVVKKTVVHHKKTSCGPCPVPAQTPPAKQ
jgi:Flp pilus assembly protein TadD